jgi:hypothetical protein
VKTLLAIAPWLDFVTIIVLQVAGVVWLFKEPHFGVQVLILAEVWTVAAGLAKIMRRLGI